MRAALLSVFLLCLLPAAASAIAVTNLTRQPQAIIVSTLGFSRHVVLQPNETYREIMKPVTLRLADGVGDIRSNDGDDEYAIWPTRGGGARLGIQRRMKSARGDGIF